MDQVHALCRRRHLSPRTEEAYRYWIRQFIFFHGKRHPRELREAEVMQFLNHLAVQRHVAASTQTQALNAIVFLYRDVLVTPLGEMGNLNRVQQRKRIPDGDGLKRGIRRAIADVWHDGIDGTGHVWFGPAR